MNLRRVKQSRSFTFYRLKRRLIFLVFPWKIRKIQVSFHFLGEFETCQAKSELRYLSPNFFSITNVMGCLFPKPDAPTPRNETIEDVENEHRKSRVKSNRFVLEDKKRRAESVRLRKNTNSSKLDRSRKAKSVKISSSSSKKKSRSRAKTDATLPKCFVCARPSNVMYGSGRRIIIQQHGTFKKKTLVFCSKEHAPSTYHHPSLLKRLITSRKHSKHRLRELRS